MTILYFENLIYFLYGLGHTDVKSKQQGVAQAESASNPHDESQTDSQTAPKVSADVDGKKDLLDRKYQSVIKSFLHVMRQSTIHISASNH